MTQKSPILAAIEQVRVEQPYVTQHDVTFQVRFLTFKGSNDLTSREFHSTLIAADNLVHEKLPNAIQNWRFINEFKEESDRLELYRFEFGSDISLPDDAVLYDIALSSSKELPLLRTDAADCNAPLSVEQLIEEIPAALTKIYAEAGISIALNHVHYFKKYVSQETGEYVIK